MTASKYLVAGTAALLLGTSAQAEKYAIATFLSPTHETTEFLHNRYAERVRDLTKGEIEFEVFAGSALLPAQGTIEGVANGVAQAGIYASSYAPSLFPIQAALDDLGLETPNNIVLSFAYTDMILHHREIDEWQNAGVVMITGAASPTGHYLCNKPGIGTLASLQGLKVRTAGTSAARVAEALGMVPVSLPASEIYTSIERGAVDCLAVDVMHLIGGQKVGELVKSVVMLDMPPGFTIAGTMVDKDFWQARTNEQRQLLLTEAMRSLAQLKAHFAVKEGENFDWAKAHGIEINEPDAALLKAYDDHVAKAVAGAADNARNNLGIQNPEPYLETFRGYLKKWEPLIESVNVTDPDALFALLEKHVIADIDVSKYGME